jgi:hypothetical protein
VIATVTGASTSTISVVKTAETIKLGADAVSVVATNKTVADHVVSNATHKNCSVLHVFQNKGFCRVSHKYLAPQILVKNNLTNNTKSSKIVINNKHSKKEQNGTKRIKTKR